MSEGTLRVALVGNPNSGKTTLFNRLTGLNQKTGNYPGVTVEKRSGSFSFRKKAVELVDLPGTYSIYPTTEDEAVTVRSITEESPPDCILFIADARSLERNMLLLTQVYDLGLPLIVVLNTFSAKADYSYLDSLKDAIPAPVFQVNARTGSGVAHVKQALVNYEQQPFKPIYSFDAVSRYAVEDLLDRRDGETDYALWHRLFRQVKENPFCDAEASLSISDIEAKGLSFDVIKKRETHQRYDTIRQLLSKTETKVGRSKPLSDTIDKFLLHPVLGYVVFLLLLLLVFQAIFQWATWPMEQIDASFAWLSNKLQAVLPPGVFTDLLTEGIVSGIGGIVIFVPQIVLLFFFITLLEESGYMTRVIFLMDRLMQPFGLSGRSVVPLMSGAACAIPAVLSARSISGKRERLTTIFVTPFMTCSARLPVYAIMIALIVPAEARWLGFSVQGWLLFGLYTLGVVAALITAFLMRGFMSAPSSSRLAMEMPRYRYPAMQSVLVTLFEKSKRFILDAGKVILAVSILLWVLANIGVNKQFYQAEEVIANQFSEADDVPSETFEAALASHKLEHSVIGYIGKGIEPIIKPLGYDWRIGIALITSFAAREVFVGTMSTLFSMDETIASDGTLQHKLAEARFHESDKPLFTVPTSISLLLFYAFAMQCMSTFAVVKQETNSWKWPTIQFVYMTALAYVSAFVAYQILQ